MKRIYLLLLIAASGIIPAHPDAVSVDKAGVLRLSDGSEAAWFGTNYTLPFAHSFREAKRRGKDPKEAIREDVCHMSRLGLNAWRIHLWDVELADPQGNLLQNEHLDLMDYLIAELQKRGIDVMITAQTNFGNGYPERDIDTGSFSCRFPKCKIHDLPEAQAIQEHYLRQLVNHRNPYTGKRYREDPSVVMLEINNEPCHSASPDVARRYIDRMTDAVRAEGWSKPVLYNASHNFSHTGAFYESKADGTTFQWYPSGLVAGHERKGNFLPAVDSYRIPWKDSIPQYGEKARVVYEFDPGDLLASYLYPAIVRTFRREGFQWITQFAYDPMFLAPYNTDYQTHYLNLAYTPSKALSMMIAARAAREIPRGKDFGSLPQDTVFGNFRVSYSNNLSDYDNGKVFIYTSSNSREPESPSRLEQIAGCGASPVVDYGGTGAYFLDRIGKGLWRLEVMPDAVIVDDPFTRPAPDRKVASVFWRSHPMRISLPSLEDGFIASPASGGEEAMASGGTFDVTPGVWFLAADRKALSSLNKEKRESLSEFHAPEADTEMLALRHNPKAYAVAGEPLDVEVTVASQNPPEKVVIYPGDIDFWSKDNKLYEMTQTGPYTYSARIPAGNVGETSYWITVDDGSSQLTYPGCVKGNPLDWYFQDKGKFIVPVRGSSDPLPLLVPDRDMKDVDFAVIASDGSGLAPDAASIIYVAPDGKNPPAYKIVSDGSAEVVLRKYIGGITSALGGEDSFSGIEVVAEGDGIIPGLVDREGESFRIPEGCVSSGGRYSLADFRHAPTYIIPAPFPMFLERQVDVEASGKPSAHDAEYIELVVPQGVKGEFVVSGVLLGK